MLVLVVGLKIIGSAESCGIPAVALGASWPLWLTMPFSCVQMAIQVRLAFTPFPALGAYIGGRV